MLAARLGLLYATYFFVVGLLAPYWQKWLDGRGLSKAEIGFVAALMIWVKVLANPLVTGRAQRLGQRRRLLLSLTLSSLLSFQLYHLGHDVLTIALVTVLFQFTLSPLVPLMESMTVDHMRESNIDYGRVRTWGSAAFLVAALAGGALFELHSAELLLPLVSAGLVIVAIGALAVPPVAPGRKNPTRYPKPIRSCFRQPGFVLFLLAAGLVQASHGAFYNFSTLHWTNHGIGETAVGLLWGLGVGAEIAFFLGSKRLVRDTAPWKLLFVAAVTGMLRWTATALSTHLLLLALAQTLHVFTFAFTHLGAMRYIEKWLPEELNPPAQGLYSATGFGLLLGLASLLAGGIYDTALGLCFLPMAAMCAIAAAAAWKLRSRARDAAARL